jgi:hypothetical protein
MPPLPRHHALPLLLLVLAASLVPRVPVLWSAEVSFNSDEAANALVIRHLVQGRELSFYNWGTRYYGIVEGLLAIPITWVTGFTPLAFKSAAVAGFLLLVAATYLLGRRLYGPAEGLAAAALLAVFSPHLVLWSTLASGGYTLIAGWGTLTFAHLVTTQRQPTAWRIAVLGWLAGFGLYIYELYLVYLALVVAWALAASFLWQVLRAPAATARTEALAQAPRQLRRAGIFLAGFVVGWAPKLITLAIDPAATKTPSYGIASLAAMWTNLKLLAARCAPALLGINLDGSRDVEAWVGPAGPLTPILGVLLLLAWIAAWLWGAARTAPELAGVLRRPPAPPGVESLLVLLVPWAALLFVLSPNPQNILSSHYLLPWLSSLPVLAGAWLVHLGRRGRVVAAAALAFLLVVFPVVQTVLWEVESGYLTPFLRLPPYPRDPLRLVLRDLRREGIRGGYGWYWIAYEATFLSDETIVIAPTDWDRYPPYTRFVDSLPNPAYIFEVGHEAQREPYRQFIQQLRAAGRPFRSRRFAQYAVVTSPHGERLVPLPPLVGTGR